uniref:ATP synthase complex subunit 8 n=1 Tax=Glyptonotus cf. antarcticus FK-2009 TaxID=692432 RepID=E3SX99_9CRUS|nr:ATP synthase F0 subunit 8 [Glyptonotus cf. antarcticus FK-2009]
MPQMAPMPWISLMFLFLLGLFIFLSVIYFLPKATLKDKTQKVPSGGMVKWMW